jgi:acetyltransferase-like isoleucine patch superfamily enzyme
LQDLARELGDGEVCPAPLLLALQAEIDARRRRTETETGPASPRTSDLLVRREGLADWWAAGDNLLLAAPTANTPELRLNPTKSVPRGIVIVLGARVVINHFNLGGQGALVVIGDNMYGAATALSCLDASTVLIGEDTTATNWAMLDACNGGIIVAGDDGMWAHGVSLMTDDTHAIRDLATGKRLNVHGGRIVIERHVWLGESARVLGGARVGHDCVVGAGAMVKNAAIADHSICVGVPARVVRGGVTWSREDAP